MKDRMILSYFKYGRVKDSYESGKMKMLFSKELIRMGVLAGLKISKTIAFYRGGENMSCNYCQNGKKILNKEVPFAPFTEEVIGYDDLICFIDRGYLRLVMEGSEQCLDHGEKVKIDYCPYCGEKLTKLKE